MSSVKSLNRGDINLNNDPKRTKPRPKSSKPTAGKARGSPSKPRADKGRSRTPGSSGRAKGTSPKPNKGKSSSAPKTKPSSSRGSTPDKRSAKSNDSSRKKGGGSGGPGKGGKDNRSGDQKQNKKPSTPKPAGILKRSGATGKADDQQAKSKNTQSKMDSVKSKVMSSKIMPFKKGDNKAKSGEKADSKNKSSKSKGASKPSTPKPASPERSQIRRRSETREDSRKASTRSRTSGSPQLKVGRERFSDWRHSCHGCEFHPRSPIIKETLDYGSDYVWNPISFPSQQSRPPSQYGFAKSRKGTPCLHPFPIPGYAMHVPRPAPRIKRKARCQRQPIRRPCQQLIRDKFSQQMKCSSKNGLYVVPCNDPRCLRDPNCGPLLVHPGTGSFGHSLNTTYIPPMPRKLEDYDPRGNSVDILNARLQYSEQILRELQRKL